MHSLGLLPWSFPQQLCEGLYSDSWHQGAWGLRALGLSSLSMWQPEAGMGITNMGQKLSNSVQVPKSLKPHVDEAQGTQHSLWHILEIQQLIIYPLL